MKTMLFLAVVAAGTTQCGPPRPEDDVPRLDLFASGLVLTTMAHLSFCSASSSVLAAKLRGGIGAYPVDLLSPEELIAGFTIEGVAWGLVGGIIVICAISPFMSIGATHSGYFIAHTLAACLMLALIGILGGLWAQDSKQLDALTAYFVTPLVFLSAAWYLLPSVPPALQILAHVNPLLYFIEGFRYGVTGDFDASLTGGLVVAAGVNVLLAAVNCRLVATGWRITPR